MRMWTTAPKIAIAIGTAAFLAACAQQTPVTTSAAPPQPARLMPECPSGQPVSSNGIGLANGFCADHGQLEAADCSGNLPMADCGGSQRVLKFWTWNGTDFTLNHTAGLTR